VILTLEAVLGSSLEKYVSDGTSTELLAVSPRVKARPARQPYRVGDVFAMPLGDGTYAYGRLLSDIRLRDLGMLVGVYDFRSRGVVPPARVLGRPYLFEHFYCGDEGWKSWRWRIIGHADLREGEFAFPRHKEGLEGLGWQIREGDRSFDATDDDVRSLSYATVWAPTVVEERVREALAGERQPG
jgi:hypothetical protein